MVYLIVKSIEKSLPRIPGISKGVKQMLGLIIGQKLLNVTQLGFELLNQRYYFALIGQTNVLPHSGIAGGDTAKILETARGIFKNFPLLILTTQKADQGKGQNMR